jgi:hypothetical protein
MRRLIPFIVLMIVIPAKSAFPGYERRSEALQLYQEGLFQETGTGDLAMAEKLYASILDGYSDYRDLACVALYHLGLVEEKLGDYTAAEAHFRKIAQNYIDQTAVASQARAKLLQLQQDHKTPERQPATAHPPIPATVSAPVTIHAVPMTEPPQGRPLPVAESAEKSAPAPENAVRFGLGFNRLGGQMRLDIGPRLQWEAKIQQADEYLVAGVRSAFRLDPVAPGLPVRPYTGLEYDVILQGTDVAGGYRVGGFIGFELRAWDRVGIGADGGYFYQNLNGQDGKAIGTVLAGNFYMTYYF